jgi:hypothetical protein
MNPLHDPMLLRANAVERALFADTLRKDPELARLLGYSVAVPNPKDLEPGDSGSDVRKLTNDLWNLGFYPKKESDSYDDEVTGAVAYFQSTNQLEATGVADAETQKAIKQALDAAKKEAKEAEKGMKAAQKDASKALKDWEKDQKKAERESEGGGFFDQLSAGFAEGRKTRESKKQASDREAAKAQREADKAARKAGKKGAGGGGTPMWIPIVAVGFGVVLIGGLALIALKE